MDDDEVVELLIRGLALFCASKIKDVRGADGVLDRARKYEEYLRGEQGH